MSGIIGGISKAIPVIGNIVGGLFGGGNKEGSGGGSAGGEGRGGGRRRRRDYDEEGYGGGYSPGGGYNQAVAKNGDRISQLERRMVEGERRREKDALEGRIKELEGRIGGIRQGGMNMIDRGQEAYGYGRQLLGNIGDAFRRRDFGGMLGQIGEGLGRFGQMGQGMLNEGRNMYDQGRQAVDYGRGMYNEVRNQYQSGRNMIRGSQGPANGITSDDLQAAKRRLRPVRF